MHGPDRGYISTPSLYLGDDASELPPTEERGRVSGGGRGREVPVVTAEVADSLGQAGRLGNWGKKDCCERGCDESLAVGLEEGPGTLSFQGK